MRSIIEIFINGQWIPAADFEPMGQGPYTGRFEYRPEYVFGDNPVPVSLTHPVTYLSTGLDEDNVAAKCPAFLLDLVPQGRGRAHLAGLLSLGTGATDELTLAQHGAFNPIGNLRLDTAVEFYRQQAAQLPTPDQGFTLESIEARQAEFLEHVWIHSMLSAGTTGVQGAAPKFLLTQDVEDLWFADAALPDERAKKHWLIKLPRGTHKTDQMVLHNEAAYLRVAQRCGLRTLGEPEVHGDMLFVPRFDRQIDSHAGLLRLHQESLASLAGIYGFGLTTSLFELVEAFRPHVTDPVSETVEFMKRDILNLAMRNTDNHARNTAVQRLPDGRVQLTPLFDFAPMYLDREVIVRGCRWKQTTQSHELTDWVEIIENLGFDEADTLEIGQHLKMFLPAIEDLENMMMDCGVDRTIIEDCKPSIHTQIDRLKRLSDRLEEAYRGPTP